ncbi:MAG: thiamine phosphate synthase [Sulfurovaceae bacterium]|nr:thiamine phosphate synthase [Sulfurovaceae bacterium]MDD5548329.1 thiamine phosphate synthase [Sulfurovaceae bacterium]
MNNLLNGLYVITDNKLTPNDKILQSIEQVLHGGANIVQLRDKINDDKKIEDISLKLQKLCRKCNALFVLNDRVDIAIKLNLDGLHIGKDDYDNIKEVRRNFKGILGVSCYDSLEMAKDMQKIGADYVAFGACFSSPTKPNAKIIDLEIIKKAKKDLNIPICAIGGINKDNVATLLQYKPDMIAIISDIWNSDDMTKRARFFTNLID